MAKTSVTPTAAPDLSDRVANLASRLLGVRDVLDMLMHGAPSIRDDGAGEPTYVLQMLFEELEHEHEVLQEIEVGVMATEREYRKLGITQPKGGA